MANARTRKREIGKAKRERAANKREKRQERLTEEEAAAAEAANGQVAGQPNEGGVLAALEALHQRYDAEQISFEDFEEARAELLSRLTVD